MNLLLRIIAVILISILVEVIVANNIPKWRKKEHDEKRKANKAKEVYLSEMLTKPGTVLMVFVVVVGILLVIFPQFCEWVEFDYTTTIVVYWIPITLDLIIYVPLLLRLKYDEEKVKYTNAFGFTRSFRYEDIVEVVETKGFVKIVTANQKIRFGKGLCGAETFIDYLKEKSIVAKFKMVER